MNDSLISSSMSRGRMRSRLFGAVMSQLLEGNGAANGWLPVACCALRREGRTNRRSTQYARRSTHRRRVAVLSMEGEIYRLRTGNATHRTPRKILPLNAIDDDVGAPQATRRPG